MVEAGRLFALASDSYWIDAGTPAQYLQAHRDLLSGARPGPPAPGAREASPGVWVLGAPVIDGEVRPDSLIGEGACVASGAAWSSSVVGAGARVDPGASVAGSVLLPGAAVAAGAAVDDSVVGAQAVIGESAVVRDLSVVGSGVVIDAGARVEGDKVPT